MEKWHDAQTITFWLVIACSVMFLLVFTIIRVAYVGFKRIVQAGIDESNMKLDHQKKLLETSILAQEKERVRIAADLHDALIGKLAKDPEEIDDMLQESISEARRISHDLSPPLIEHKSLGELIETVTDPWQKSIRIAFHQDIRQEDTVTPMIKIHFLRIVQELITNIYKHAQADQIDIHLRCTPKWITLLIRDNGRGFDPEAIKKGLGMYNIELRMQHIGGTYRIKPARSKGVSSILALESKTESVL